MASLRLAVTNTSIPCAGTEEEDYWSKMEESKSHKRKPGFRGRSTWSGGRKRKQRYNSNAPGDKPSVAKQPKTED